MTGAIAALQQGLAQFALHALWQVPLLAGAAWCAIRLGRPHVRVAYGLWVGTLLLCVAMPLVATIAARHAAFKAQRALQDSSITYEARAYDGDLPALERAPAWKRLLHRHLNGRDGLQPFAFALSQRAARAISCGYLVALLFFSAQLFAAWRRTRALVAGGSDEALPGSLQIALEQQCQELSVAVPQACLHPEIAGPALAGVVDPVLLLPAACTQEMSAAEIDAVLAHELAHLRRRDPLVHAVCSLLLVPVALTRPRCGLRDVCGRPARWRAMLTRPSTWGHPPRTHMRCCMSPSGRVIEARAPAVSAYSATDCLEPVSGFLPAVSIFSPTTVPWRNVCRC